MKDTSAALEHFMIYSGMADRAGAGGGEGKKAAGRAGNALGAVHEQLWSSFQSAVTADSRAKNPKALNGAFTVGKSGSVSYGGKKHGAGGNTEEYDQEGDDDDEESLTDAADKTTKVFADALSRHLFQRDPTAMSTVGAGAASLGGGASVATGTLKTVAQKKKENPVVVSHSRGINALPAGLVEHTANHARAMEAQQASTPPANASKLYKYIPVTFCTRGAVAVSNATVFTCEYGTSGVQTLTSAQFAALTAAQQANCSIDSGTGLECVCPYDYVLGTPLFGQPNCYLKRMDCNSTIRSPVQNCPNVSINENWIKPECFSIPLSTTTSLTVEANTTCGLVYTPPAFYEATGVTLNAVSTDVMTSFYVTLPSLDYTVVAGSVNTVMGPYNLLDVSAFGYVVDTFVMGERLAISPDNTIMTSGGFFSQMYNFRRLSDQSQLKTQSVTAATASTLLTGIQNVVYTFDLSNLDTQFIAGGRMYLEAGYAGDIRSKVAADSITIDISDYSPPEKSQGLADGVVTALIVVGVILGLALLVTLIVGVRWYKTSQQKKTDSEEEY